MPDVCEKCGQPIPERTAPCPLCGTVAPGRPLSLDDAVQLPSTTPQPARRSLLRSLVFLAVIVAVGVGTFLASRYGSRFLGSPSLQAFTSPDGSCSVKLPGEPVEESVSPTPGAPAARGGKRYVAHRGSVTASVGWQDLDPERAKLTRGEDLIAAEVGHRSTELGGTVTREATMKFSTHDGREVRYETPNGPWVERYIFVLDGRPRLYLIGIGGPKADPDGQLTREVLDSFRLLK